MQVTLVGSSWVVVAGGQTGVDFSVPNSVQTHASVLDVVTTLELRPASKFDRGTPLNGTRGDCWVEFPYFNSQNPSLG